MQQIETGTDCWGFLLLLFFLNQRIYKTSGAIRSDVFAEPLCKPEELCMPVALSAPMLRWREVRVDVSSEE